MDYFKRALPVWPAGREMEMNTHCSFTADLPEGELTLRVACGCLYRGSVDGVPFAYGPARAAHGYARVDEWPLPPGKRLELSVAGYCVNSYYTLRQPSFLRAEVFAGEESLLATGRDFLCRLEHRRLRRAERYSFQRGFTEVWDMTLPEAAPAECLPLPPVKLLPRRVALPEMGEVLAALPVDEGRFTAGHIPSNYIRFRQTRISENYLGYPDVLPEHRLTDRFQEMRFVSGGREGGEYAAGEYLVRALPGNRTGFPLLEAVCREETELLLYFDERLTGGKIDPMRCECCNIIKLRLPAGASRFTAFECYTCQFMGMAVLSGRCEVRRMGMLEYKAPPAKNGWQPPAEDELLYRAAEETLRQNALDIFMDCPSRERGGWLCDSWFAARAQYAITGDLRAERNFLENYLLSRQDPALPEGMPAMCYPADHPDGGFIVNWAQWLVLQLADSRSRGMDEELLRAFRPRVDKVLALLRSMENDGGLLENVPGWNFVEWSRANDLVRDVNYPTNMLYALTLEAAAGLYGYEALRDKAEALRETVRGQSYDGRFFRDRAFREGNSLRTGDEVTEVCQYYAFFTRAATPESHPALWRRLVEDFGVRRKDTGLWPEVAPANVFVGYMLRMELFRREGMYDRLRRELRETFDGMASATGTLWEMESPTASLCHGFAAYAGALLREAAEAARP
ncbi:MAG: hypothetical protein ACOX17_00600 [Christensenellales bacterium]|jgi:alpha-L-rhamnosidase